MAAEEVDVDIEGDESELNLSDINGGTSGFLQDHYLQSAWGPSPGVIPWTLDSSISDENRVVIENMLLEEEYYLTGKQLPQNLWTSDKQGTEKVKRSPVKSSTFPIRWTQEEKDIFEKGLAQFGRRWTKIAKLIGSRSVLQVKGYARQYFKTKAKTDNPSKDRSSKEIPCVSSGDGSGSEPHPASFCEAQADTHLNTVRIERLSDDEDVDITDDADGGARLQLSDVDGETPEEGSAHTASCVEAEEVQPSSVTVPPSTVEPETSTAYYEVHDAVGGQLSGLTPTAVCEGQTSLPVELDSGPSSGCISSKEGADPLVLSPVTPDEENEADGVFVQSLPEHELSEGTAQSEQVPGADYESPEEEEEEEMLKPPEEEVEMDRNAIIEEEKQAISEFFEGRSSKTPERYLKIRNYILDQWEKCKPKYLNKTSVRPGLKNCGDVNCIGRVHTYLELIGAINFGCEQAVYNRPRLVDKTRFKEGKDTMEAYQLAQRLQSMRTRKRRVRDVWGNWRDARDLEGQTYEHLTAEELAKRREEDKKTLPKPPKVPRQAKNSFDPFQLIPCQAFGGEKQEPFQVRVSGEALVVMDMHAHVSMAEVIGLLGGGYSEGERVLEICVAEPCNSLSTGLQCEMDPVSQTQASEALAGRGYSVVGWYHSHPAFDPNPSLRDIDTQAKFQSYFSRGGAQFIGMIVSPYNPTNASPHSQVTCLIVSEDLGSAGAHGLPFKFEIQQSPQEPQWPLVLKKAEWIIDKYRLSRGSVPMDRIFRRDSNLSCLEKMLVSMRNSLGSLCNGTATEGFLAQIETLFLDTFAAEIRNSAVLSAQESENMCPFEQTSV
ncbi:histone H2A deubiquitinase MYSM1 isoform X1 [Acipenser oxyrinchus oxyrinchus]|uniref:Myb-like, SWIRM and MPN domain-containing protein 1 n=1 Tax=Acipenser oxyrinchus oxyrinchus TaxID=40147 RepID=A0AAD8DBY0_ACIOX|nr:histone H2A deubiquitinase MYSM1 isoform X1 [Acipenser oxyrinchus oxyrinchus]